MKILDYVINTKVFIKTEPTAFSALPIDNSSDNFYLVIPSLISDLPNDVMFISYSILIPPHTTKDYIPKFVRLGASNIGQRLSTEVTGIKLKLIIIDSIAADDMIITESYTLKSNNSKVNTSTHTNITNTITSDGTTIKTDNETAFILNMIDSRINQHLNRSTVQQVTPTIVNSPIATAVTNDIINTTIKKSKQQRKKNIVLDADGNPIVRKRGRPKKIPITTSEVTSILTESK